MSYGENGSVIGPINTPTSSVASGVWSLGEVAEAQRDGIWPNPTQGWVAWWDAVNTSQSINSKVSLDVDSNGNVAFQYISAPDSNQSPSGRYTTVNYIDGSAETQTWARNQGVNSSTVSLQKYFGSDTSSVIFDSSDEVVIAASSVSLTNHDGWKSVTSIGEARGFVLMNWNKTNGNQLNYSKIILREVDQAYTTGAICKGAQTSSTIFSSMFDNDSGTIAIYQSAKSNGAHVSTQTWNSPSGGTGMINGGGGNNGYAVGAGYAWTTHGGASQTYHALYVTNVPGSTANGDNYNLYITTQPGLPTMGYSATMNSAGTAMYCVLENETNTPCASIVKLNTSTNAITWQQTYKGTAVSNYAYPRAVCADSNENTYTIGHVQANVNGLSGYHTFIIKHNSAGVRQWTRMLDFVVSGSARANYGKDISVDAAGEFIYVGVWLLTNVGPQVPVALKLATDGTGTGSTATSGTITTVHYYDGATHMVSGFNGNAGSLSVQEGYMNDSSTDYLGITSTGLPQTNTTPTPPTLNLEGV
tara:strand:+ start:2312 stop:3901 length:1590 start_codon:yes stop_codon:yes gene_type:complete